MTRQRALRLWFFALAFASSSAFAAPDPAYQELQGPWQVVELVDNGRVIPADVIPSWLPSGGRMELLDNAIVFTAPKDGQRHARVYSLDATTYPRQINIIEQNKIYGHGIYRMDDGRLIVCLSPPPETPRPMEFSAPEGSRRVLMVLARPKVEPTTPATPAKTVSTTTVLNLPPPPAVPAAPVAPAAPQPGTQALTNADVQKLLPGNWKFNDTHGAFYLTLDKKGVFSTYRESVETSAYQKVFRKLPLSSGTWKLNNGQVVLTCTSSVFADRVYKTFPFTIRSVSATDLSFVDYAGNQGKATRAQP
jgi:uncharacterized protein (TIGR03067 family)